MLSEKLLNSNNFLINYLPRYLKIFLNCLLSDMANSDIQISTSSNNNFTNHIAKMCCSGNKISYLNWRVLKDFIHLNKYMFPSWKSDSFLCFILVILASAFLEYLKYKVGLLTGTFYQVLGDKDIGKNFSFKNRSDSCQILAVFGDYSCVLSVKM